MQQLSMQSFMFHWWMVQINIVMKCTMKACLTRAIYDSRVSINAYVNTNYNFCQLMPEKLKVTCCAIYVDDVSWLLAKDCFWDLCEFGVLPSGQTICPGTFIFLPFYFQSCILKVVERTPRVVNSRILCHNVAVATLHNLQYYFYHFITVWFNASSYRCHTIYLKTNLFLWDRES